MKLKHISIGLVVCLSIIAIIIAIPKEIPKTKGIQSMEVFDYRFNSHFNTSLYHKINITLYFSIQIPRNLTVKLSEGNNRLGVRYINQPYGTYELTFNCYFLKNHTYTLTVRAYGTYKQTINT